MQATEKKSINKIWLAVLSVGVVIAIILGIVALVDHGDTKANPIPTINQQVDNIVNTLPELEKVRTEMKGYIDTLETTTQKLQSDLTATNTAIDTLETEVYGKVDAEKTATLNQLKADKTELERKIAAAIKDQDADVADLQKQISAINTDISTIKTELDGKATASEQKVLGELNALKTSIEGELATINNAIAALQAKDEELDRKIFDLQTYVDTQLRGTEDWANATFATLTQYEEVQTVISEIKALIATINTDIDTIEKDVAEKVEAINKSIADLDAELATKVTEITSAYTEAIATAKDDITAAYTKAIADAISQSETFMKAWVNEQLEQPLKDIADLQAALQATPNRIQSLTYVPSYSDGKVLIDYTTGSTKLYFRISPASLATSLTADKVTAYAHYTTNPTTPASYAPAVPLTVTSVVGDEWGILEVNIEESSENSLSNDFWTGKCEAVIYIVITNGATEIASEAIPMIAHNYDSTAQKCLHEVMDKGVCKECGTLCYVDLGLPSGKLWATYNVGASNPWDYGDFFSWGETSPKDSYTWDNYTWGTKDNLTKYNNTDGKQTLEAEDDAATVNMGAGWSTPTLEDWDELRAHCTWEWTTVNGVSGCTITGNGNSIFLPATGRCQGTNVRYQGTQGCYWLNGRYFRDYDLHLGLSFMLDSHGVNSVIPERTTGMCVRAVYTENN